MPELDRVLQFWKDCLTFQGYLISPAAQVFIRATIHYLEELQSEKGGLK